MEQYGARKKAKMEMIGAAVDLSFRLDGWISANEY